MKPTKENLGQFDQKTEQLLARFLAIPGVELRSVFGEWGLFRNQVMFCWIVHGTCYLRSARSDLAFSGFAPLLQEGGKKFHSCSIEQAQNLKEEQLVRYVDEVVQFALSDREKKLNSKRKKVLEAAQKWLRLPEKKGLTSLMGG